MQASKTVFSEEIFSSTPESRLEVSLAYQDLPSGLRARQFLYDVLDLCQMEVEFNLTLWNVGLFHTPEILEEAVFNACEANLVVLSLRGDSGLEPDTEKWITQWIERHSDEESALAVLIGCDEQRLDLIGQTLLWLQHVTRPTEVRLFVGFMPPTGAGGPSLSRTVQPKSASASFIDPDVLDRLDAHSEGGLNE
jgi:hypothetical protein